MRYREIKSGVLLSVPWVDPDTPYRSPNDVTEQESYQEIPLIYRALNLRCDTLTRIPVYVYGPDDEPIEAGYKWEKQYPLNDLLWLSEAAVLLRGQAFNLILRNGFGESPGLQWLNPFSISIEHNRNGEILYYQLMPDGQRFPGRNSYWGAEDFLPMKLFNPSDDDGFGISAAEVALGDSKIFKSVNWFLGNYFSSGALPVTLLSFPKGADKKEAEAAATWFKKQLRKLRGAAERVLGIDGELKVDKLTSDLNTFDFDKVDLHAVNNIAWAFSIPKTILTADSANRATAETEYRSYLDYTILPRCKWYERALNPYLEQFNQRIEFAPEEMPEYQVDEAARAGSLKALVDAGVPLEAALDILGYDLSEEAQAALDKKLQEKEKLIVPDQQQEDEMPTQMKADLDRWKRKALSSLKGGGAAEVEFQSDAIGADAREGISSALKTAKTAEEICAAFKGDTWKTN